jgi:hypothetical protein
MLKTCKPTVLFLNDVTLSFMYFILLCMICNTFSFKIYLYVTYFYCLEILALLITIQFVLHVIWTMQYYATLICFTCIVSTCSISCWVITQCCMDQLNVNKSINQSINRGVKIAFIGLFYAWVTVMKFGFLLWWLWDLLPFRVQTGYNLLANSKFPGEPCALKMKPASSL